MRLALDTNLLVSAVLLPGSVPGRVVSAWRAQAFVWVCCAAQWEELNEALTRHYLLARIPSGIAPVHALLRDMRNLCGWAPVSKPFPAICRDPDDDFLFALSDGGYIDAIVSGDNDVLALRPGYTVWTARDLIDRL